MFALCIVLSGCTFVLNTPVNVAKTFSTDAAQPAGPPVNSDQNGDEWPMFRGALNHSGFVTTTPQSHVGEFWHFNTTGQVASSPAIVGNRVYFGSGMGDDNVYCLYANNGTKVWNKFAGAAVDTSPAISSGCVFIGSPNGSMYCLNASTGKIMWDKWIGIPMTTTPSSVAVANGSVYFGCWNTSFMCLNATTGLRLWNYTAGDSIESAPAIVGNYAYFGCYDNCIYCVRTDTHGLSWKTKTGSYISGTPSVINGLLYACGDDHMLHCIYANNGTSKWNYTTGGSMQGSPAVWGGRVYVGSQDYSVHCVNAISGAFIWSYSTGAYPMGGYTWTPTVAAGHVFVGCDDGKVYFLNATTGAFEWAYQTWGTPGTPSVANGRVYVGSSDHTLYCLPIVTAPSAPRSCIADVVSGHIHLSWWVPTSNGGSPITGYNIYRGATWGSGTLYHINGNVTSYDDLSVVAGTAYYYHVTAFNSALEGPISGETWANVGNTPSAPQNLVASSPVGSGSVVLTWQTPASAGDSAITGYRISRSPISGYEFIMKSLGVMTTWTDTSVESGSTYFYKVCAVNSVGLGAFSTEASVTPLVTTISPNFTQHFDIHSGSFNVSVPTTGSLNITASASVSGEVSLVISAWTSNPMAASPGFVSDSSAIYLYLSSNDTSLIIFPVTVTVPLPASLQGIAASSLKIETYDAAQGRWVDAGFTITISEDNTTATVTVTHFSMFSLGQTPAGGGVPGYSLWIVGFAVGLAVLAECVALRKRKFHVI